MVRHASLWTLQAVDGVVRMVTELDGMGRFGKNRDDTHVHISYMYVVHMVCLYKSYSL